MEEADKAVEEVEDEVAAAAEEKAEEREGGEEEEDCKNRRGGEMLVNNLKDETSTSMVQPCLSLSEHMSNSGSNESALDGDGEEKSVFIQ